MTTEQVQAEREEVDVVQFVRSAPADRRDAARCQSVRAAERGDAALTGLSVTSSLMAQSLLLSLLDEVQSLWDEEPLAVLSAATDATDSVS